jgi:hypothetical protein
MGRRLRAVLALGAAIWLYACTIRGDSGEAPGHCDDGLDNDSDEVMDCHDPDCQALSLCSASLVADHSPRPPPGQIGDAYVGEPEDSGVTAPPEPEPSEPDPPDDDPDDDDDDEPSEPEPEPTEGCPDGCGPNQLCVVDQCLDMDLVVADVWTISRITASVPRSIDMDVTQPDCLDATCVAFYFRQPPYLDCECPADPKVEVWVDLDPSDDLEAELAGETEAATKEDQGAWSTPIEIRLLASSTVQLRVVDVDGMDQEPIYGCDITSASEVVASTGMLECKRQFPSSDAIAPIDFAISAQVEPAQAP